MVIDGKLYLTKKKKRRERNYARALCSDAFIKRITLKKIKYKLTRDFLNRESTGLIFFILFLFRGQVQNQLNCFFFC